MYMDRWIDDWLETLLNYLDGTKVSNFSSPRTSDNKCSSHLGSSLMSYLLVEGALDNFISVT